MRMGGIGLFFFQAEDGIRDLTVTGDQTCALPIWGLGGVLALVIALLFGIVMPFLNSNEVADLYERVGRRAPVTALTGLWYFPGIFIVVGPIDRKSTRLNSSHSQLSYAAFSL